MKNIIMVGLAATLACAGNLLWGQDLAVASPESQGVSSKAVLRWIEACESASATNMLNGHLHGFVILRHGRTIAEGTWAPQNTLEKPHMLYSHSKSFTSTAIGFLVDDGKIDLDQRVISFFPDETPENPSENLRQARVRDLLTMNLGADHTDAERDDIKGDWVKAMLRNKIDREPGTGFKYDSGATHLLAAIVEKASGKPLMEFLKERLFDPLGMTSPWSTVSPTGIACGGWGMNMTTRDIARFGQFLLQEGRWDGRQLLSREWVRLASARQTWSGGIVVQAKTIGSGSDWNQGYGFQFWRCRHDAYRADGASGQLTVVFPDQDAVVSVHAGLGNMQRELDLVWEHLLPAFGAVALAEDETALAELRTKCASLALPLEDAFAEVFEGFDKANCETAPDGWILTMGGRRLNVGDGKWAETSWKFDDTNVEPLFANCGTRDIAATGRLLPDGSLSVTWQMLGGIRHGHFTVAAPMRVTLTFDDSLKDHLLIAAPLLEERGWRGTFNLVTDLVGSGEKYLTWDDVRELVRRGHEIATHTKTHCDLLGLLKAKGEVAVKNELAESRDAIAAETGFTPRFLCSPFARQDEATARLCREEGLRQMYGVRVNFGQGTEGRTRQIVESRIASGEKRLDILHHGIAADGHGGWRPFCDRQAFERHLDDIAALEREGKIVVTDYDGMVSDCRLSAAEWPRHGVLALSFDDRGMASWERVYPLFEKYGASVTFFLCGTIGPDEVGFARRALSMGHEVGLHGLKHRNADEAVAQLGQDGYWEAEVEPQLSAFLKAGVPIRSFAYPNCRRNATTDAVFAAHGFTRVRGTPDGVKSPNPYDPKGEKKDKWRPVVTSDEVFVPAAQQLAKQLIGNVIMGENYHTDIEDIVRAMHRAGGRAETLSIVSHGIAPDARGIAMKTEWLERMLAVASECGVVVRGVR